MSILGIDFGSKRIGLALADADSKLATPLKTISGENDTFSEIGEIITQNDVTTVVIGLPRSLEGEDTPQTKSATEFAEQVKSHFGLPVFMQDEALTSEIAEDRLNSAHPGKMSKELVDQEAAAIILQDYLDGL